MVGKHIEFEFENENERLNNIRGKVKCVRDVILREVIQVEI